MRCTSPSTVGFLSDGKTICWSQSQYSKEYATFQLPCGKCLQCRLEYARSAAVRCTHEAQMHPANSFVTLTYSDQHLESPKLVYEHMQLFMKKLRRKLDYPIKAFTVGEYGEKNKRPHWHQIIFGLQLKDEVPLRKNEMGDQLYTSSILDATWGKNDANKKPNEIGRVTFHSAGYVARYSAKKIVHGPNQKVCEADYHEWQPKPVWPRGYGVGAAWLEKFWPDIFSLGNVILPDGQPCGAVPRYYEKWLKEKLPHEWERYVTQVKSEKIARAYARSETEKAAFAETAWRRFECRKPTQKTANEIRKVILEAKFKQLQEYLKL